MNVSLAILCSLASAACLVLSFIGFIWTGDLVFAKLGGTALITLLCGLIWVGIAQE